MYLTRDTKHVLKLQQEVFCNLVTHFHLYIFLLGQWPVKEEGKVFRAVVELQGGQSTEPRWWCHLVARIEVDACSALESQKALSLQHELFLIFAKIKANKRILSLSEEQLFNKLFNTGPILSFKPCAHTWRMRACWPTSESQRKPKFCFLIHILINELNYF